MNWLNRISSWARVSRQSRISEEEAVDLVQEFLLNAFRQFEFERTGDVFAQTVGRVEHGREVRRQLKVLPVYGTVDGTQYRALVDLLRRRVLEFRPVSDAPAVDTTVEKCFPKHGTDSDTSG